MQLDKLELELCTPERAPVQLGVIEVIIPGAQGVFTVHPGHTPLLSNLDIGVVVAYEEDGSERFFAVNRGFAEIIHNKVIILTQTVEESAEIDKARAERARERAEKRLRVRDPDIDILRAEAALQRALCRLQTSGRIPY